jgi:hypothetical protein
MIIRKFGEYTVVRGKLSPDDSRSHYVTGPTLDGRIAPLSSHWDEQSAIASAKRMSHEHDSQATDRSDI